MREFVQSAQRELTRLDQEIDRLGKEAQENYGRRALLRSLLALYACDARQPVSGSPLALDSTIPLPPIRRSVTIRAAARTPVTLTLPQQRKAAHHKPRQQPPPRQKVTREEVIEAVRSLSTDHSEGVGPTQIIDKLKKPDQYIDYPQVQTLMANLARGNEIRKLGAGRYLPLRSAGSRRGSSDPRGPG
jgi:hypothetical protein